MRLRVLTPLRAAGPRWSPAARAVVAMLFAVAALAASAPAAWSDDFVLIRNAKNPTSSITPAQAKEMAIGKRKVWPHGAVVGLGVLDAHR